MSSGWQSAAMRDLCTVSGRMGQCTVLLKGYLDRQSDRSAFNNINEGLFSFISSKHKWPPRHTSSKMWFFALMIAVLRAWTHNSFSSGVTARKTRLGACNNMKSIVDQLHCVFWVESSEWKHVQSAHWQTYFNDELFFVWGQNHNLLLWGLYIYFYFLFESIHFVSGWSCPHLTQTHQITLERPECLLLKIYTQHHCALQRT